MKTIALLVISLLSFNFSIAQEWKTRTVDEIFTLAREKAFAGDRQQSRIMLKEILKRSPEYDEVSVFLARTYSWEGQRDTARAILQTVLLKLPRDREALLASADVDSWDDRYESALLTVNKGLEKYFNDEAFLYRKAYYLKQLNREKESAQTLQLLLTIQPAHQQGLRLLSELKNASLKYATSASYSTDLFSRTFSPAQYTFIQLARTFKWGTAMTRVNYSNRFGQSGAQAEIDLYPRLFKGTYGYFNYGYSSSDLYPLHRIGTEFFSKLPKAMEISAGARFLSYNQGSPVIIYTGSLGWYFKNNWVSMRPYFTPGTTNSYSTYFFLRHYLHDGNNYIGVSGGFGFSPDDRRIQSSNGLSQDNIYMLKSQRVGLYWQKTFSNNWMITTTFFMGRQELSFERGNYVWTSSPMISLRKSF